jgi:hypothetical protein
VGLFGKPKTVLVQIQGTMMWEGYYDLPAKTWIGICKALNLNAIGDTWPELQACANDAMEALFQDLLKTGELEEFLRVNRWRKQGEAEPGAQVRFDVPSDWRSTARFEDLVPA